MPQILLFVVLGILAYVPYAIIRAQAADVREAREADRHGCELTSQVPRRKWLFGLDLFLAMLRADGAGRRSEYYRSLHLTHGPTYEINSVARALHTASPQNIKTICTSAFDCFGVGPSRGSIGVPFIDRGIFTEDGAYWKYSRGLVQPTFSRAEIADLSNFERHVGRFLNLIPTDGKTFDLMPLVKRMFLDSSTEFLFGQSIDSQLLEDTSEADEFMQAFDRSLLGLALILVTGPLRHLLYWDPGWRKAYVKVHAFVDKHIQRVLEQKGNSDAATDTVKKGRYVLLEEIAAYTRDPYELRMQMINVFFPARDTAAIAFSDCVFELARHPEEWKKLRDEVLELHDEALTYERLKSLQQVKAIINETLRLHPAASKIGRICLRDTVLPTGGGRNGKASLFVPKGRAIEMDLYTLQRNPAIWGADAEEFRPARWQPGRPLWESRWEYEPFLGGVRMCPAQNQVLTQIAYLIVRFAQRFESLDCRDPVLEYYERVAMTVESRNGVLVAVEPAKDV